MQRNSLTTLGLFVGLAILAGVATLAYRRLSSLEEAERWVAHTHEVLDHTQALVIAVGDAGRARRSFAVTRDEAELEPYRTALWHIDTSRTALRRLTADNPAQKVRLEQLEVATAARLAHLEGAIREARAHPFDAEREARFTDAGTVLTAKVRASAGEIQAEERQLLDARLMAERAGTTSVKRTLVFGFSASSLILLVAFAFSRREVMLRRRSEEALAEREARFRKLVDAAPDAIVITGVDGRITIANDQAGTLFGYPPGDLIGAPVATLIPDRPFGDLIEQPRGIHETAIARALGTGIDLFARRKDGTVRPVEVTLSPLETPEGTQLIAAVRDVTVRRELERFRDEYVGYISHDLKNPLSIIVLQARLLERLLGERASADERHALRAIAHNASFIDKLVRELLEMAYLESEEIRLQPEPMELGTFLELLLARSISLSERPRLQLEIAEPATVSAESSRLERVLVNFIQNAVKYSPPGSPIRVRLETRGNSAQISVSDVGPGIPPEDRAYVFDKYRRTASAKTAEGLGLGLYISRKIIEAHHGEIGVEETGGQGATFFIRLPRIEAPAREAGPRVAVPRDLPSQHQGRRILLVDDEPNAVSALSVLLRDEGLEVTSATSGQQALALAGGDRPDVAVVDVQMPGMDGLTLLEKLRERFPGLPAVIMSGHMERHAGITQERQASGAAYVGKPVNLEELLRSIDRLLPPLPLPPS